LTHSVDRCAVHLLTSVQRHESNFSKLLLCCPIIQWLQHKEQVNNISNWCRAY